MVPLVVANLAGGLFHTSSAGSEIQSIDTWANQVAANGDQATLNTLVTKAGLAGGTGIAATEQGKNEAKQQLANLMNAGIVVGPAGTGDYGLPPGTPNLLGQYVVTGKTGIPSSTAVVRAQPGTQAGGGITGGISRFIQSITGPAQANIGQQAGVAAAQKAQSTVLIGALIIGLAVVIGLRLTRK